MEAPKTLRRPSNWQDFESLCKKLWGEIWNCPEIKKNGRVGQSQNGVDIYGIPFNENQYFGIQCKGKDEYTNKQFTEAEIEGEIAKSKHFKPPLKKLYFATTANKDVEIEEFVRKKNIEHISAGLFEVHLYSWEDIVDLIDENRETHDWYINSQKYKSKKSISLTFQNDKPDLTCYPHYKQIINYYKQKATEDPYFNPLSFFAKQLGPTKSLDFRFSPDISSQENLSFIGFGIRVKNNGFDSIDNFQILFEFEGDILDIAFTNEIGGLSAISQINSDIEINEDTFGIKVKPKQKTLVSEENYDSRYIYIKPSPLEKQIIIHWRFLSKDFKVNGELRIKLLPKFEKVTKTIYIDGPILENDEEGKIEDYIIDKK